MQWSQLEMAILGIIMQVEPMDPEKAYLIFGGLDIQPRLNMAINLARQNKLPPLYVSRIVAMRTKVQGPRGGSRAQKSGCPWCPSRYAGR